MVNWREVGRRWLHSTTEGNGLEMGGLRSAPVAPASAAKGMKGQIVYSGKASCQWPRRVWGIAMCCRERVSFGSYIAAEFGLGRAQKYLGHVSSQTTVDYYADLVFPEGLRSFWQGYPL